ncbi:MAG: OmpA family protein [Spirochaetia bacterium]|nr:OmpA family protein [Spirochaetia bacterium]
MGSLVAAQPTRIPWNTARQEFGASLSSSGSLYFYSNRNGKSTDLFVSKRVNGAFLQPQELSDLNSPYDDQNPFIFPEENAIIFSSNRDGAHEFRTAGGIAVSRDLYFSRKVAGAWTRPERMPDTINSDMMEENPFLHGKRLYFVRYPFGKPELARIYFSEAGEDTWGEAKQLFDFQAITPGVFGDRFYFAQKSGAHYQIVSVPLEKINSKVDKLIRPEPGLDPAVDEAAYAASNDGSLVVFARRSKTGDYDLFEFKPDPWTDKETFSLTNILFKRAESTILPESNELLDRLAAYLKGRKTAVLVTGHTDKTGDADANLKLSHDRANSVKAALVRRGIPANLIRTDGKGQTQPVDPAANETAYAKNRRTEFKILPD